MAVEGGSKCVKYLLFFFNLIFWICGLALIVLGVIAQVALHNTAVLKGASGGALVLIGVGVIIFFIAFFGCCGALKENHCMVTTFAVILSLITIIEIGSAIAVYVYRGEVNDLVTEGFKEIIDNYNTTASSGKAIDEIQIELKCCGANSSDDWLNFKPAHDSVPDSCCINMTANCGIGAIHNHNKIHTQGCQPAVVESLKRSILWVGVAALVIAFVQMTGIVLACVLMRAIREGYEIM
ncbi:CD63 antigen [Triplophysa dalaica]|uniref:CD63 antigen n=1 Tax=Triplophysa dalaica TaxID=1582913 RepID=UPI0024DF424E|nr:CD63 antigen [Triplophysa dalaica]XP_056588656.1 CD63 antigen [Triplophysa dalaica]XP_056588657.1 CD63 antigen [Triplophysa dalaica]